MRSRALGPWPAPGCLLGSIGGRVPATIEVGSLQSRREKLGRGPGCWTSSFSPQSLWCVRLARPGSEAGGARRHSALPTPIAKRGRPPPSFRRRSVAHGGSADARTPGAGGVRQQPCEGERDAPVDPSWIHAGRSCGPRRAFGRNPSHRTTWRHADLGLAGRGRAVRATTDRGAPGGAGCRARVVRSAIASLATGDARVAVCSLRRLEAGPI